MTQSNRNFDATRYFITVVLLCGCLVVGIVMSWTSLARERRNPEVWWSRADYAKLGQELKDIPEVCFLSDTLRNANTRIHSIQYNIIPTRLIVETEWPAIFKQVEAGTWIVVDVENPAKLDETEHEIATWAQRVNRPYLFQRLSKNLALMRSPTGVEKE